MNRKKSTISESLSEQGKRISDIEREKDMALLALMKKGGRSVRPNEDTEIYFSSKTRLLICIPGDIAVRAKQAAEAREVKISSHSWIVEAILEKLKRESF